MLLSTASFLHSALLVMSCLRPDESRQASHWQEGLSPLWRSVEIGNGLMKFSGSGATTATSVMQRIGPGRTSSLVGFTV